ncbi:hypothetical protein BGZ60DRAFT_533897 [Tricladium varicosporioides]|nr:hypothetical protein BGZ60DRAFT_533897 [Hymenoscyphus varicosporioides]
MKLSNSCRRSLWLLAVIGESRAETYTGSCLQVTDSMQVCASRWDSIRTECTKTVTTNTIWPGPCECSYYANDLPCFDEFAICAYQAWTQVPSWFREGVTSCIMKVPGYTIRAQLGNEENPFTIASLTNGITETVKSGSASSGGISTSSSSAVTGLGSGSSLVSSTVLSSTSSIKPTGSNTSNTPPSTDTPSPARAGLSTGQKIGIGIGVAVFAIIFLILAFFGFQWRRKNLQRKHTESGGFEKPELPNNEKRKEENFLSEMGDNVINEMDASPRNVELIADGGQLVGQPVEIGVPKREMRIKRKGVNSEATAPQ